LGGEPQGWEDLRDDRPPSELARDIAGALGFVPDLASRQSTIRLAAAIRAFRPRARPWLAADLAGIGGGEAAALPLVDALAAANRRLRDEHDQLVRQAARLLLGADEIPTKAVELGLLGLRYRRENERSGG
jgi:hypothetical protein